MQVGERYLKLTGSSGLDIRRLNNDPPIEGMITNKPLISSHRAPAGVSLFVLHGTYLYHSPFRLHKIMSIHKLCTKELHILLGSEPRRRFSDMLGIKAPLSSALHRVCFSLLQHGGAGPERLQFTMRESRNKGITPAPQSGRIYALHLLT